MPNVALSNIFDNGQSLGEPQVIKSTFNTYFVNDATDIQSFIRYSKIICMNFSLQLIFYSTVEVEVKNIIIFLNPSKTVGLNSIPTKIY